MPRDFGKLSVLKVTRLSKPGYYGDGGGLFLQVCATGAKSWILRFRRFKKRREMGLGSVHVVPLASARERAHLARVCLAEGKDPIEERKKEMLTLRSQKEREMEFDACVKLYIEMHEAGWRNAKHRKQWESTLHMYVSPRMGKRIVRQVDTADVLGVLEPLWRTKTETASRIRERIERVLAWATVRGYRAGENPARWRGHLDEMLPKPAKVKKVKHHPALPHSKIAEFVSALKRQPGIAARAMEFTILTASRSGEVVGCRWEEIDFDSAVWTIPAERMKANRIHRVPLTPTMISLLKGQVGLDDEYVFASPKPGKPLSNMAMLATLKRMGRDDITVHGFRSTFRDWAADETAHSREVVEMALAHTVGSAVENAYRRSDLFEKRRQLMEDWNARCYLLHIENTTAVEAAQESPGSCERRLEATPPSTPPL